MLTCGACYWNFMFTIFNVRAWKCNVESKVSMLSSATTTSILFSKNGWNIEKYFPKSWWHRFCFPEKVVTSKNGSQMFPETSATSISFPVKFLDIRMFYWYVIGRKHLLFGGKEFLKIPGNTFSQNWFNCFFHQVLLLGSLPPVPLPHHTERHWRRKSIDQSIMHHIARNPWRWGRRAVCQPFKIPELFIPPELIVC